MTAIPNRGGTGVSVCVVLFVSAVLSFYLD